MPDVTTEHATRSRYVDMRLGNGFIYRLLACFGGKRIPARISTKASSLPRGILCILLYRGVARRGSL